METITRLDVNAVLLRTKSSKPSTENIRDERVYVYILFVSFRIASTQRN